MKKRIACVILAIVVALGLGYMLVSKTHSNSKDYVYGTFKEQNSTLSFNQDNKLYYYSEVGEESVIGSYSLVETNIVYLK